MISLVFASLGHHGHDAPQWSRIKCVVILLGSAVLISLCADRVTENIQPLLETSGISEVKRIQSSISLASFSDICLSFWHFFHDYIRRDMRCKIGQETQNCKITNLYLDVNNVNYNFSIFYFFSILLASLCWRSYQSYQK